MLPFAINLIVFALISIAFSRRLDPCNGGSKLYLVLVSVELLSFMAISPVISDAITYASYARYQLYGNLEPGWIIVSRALWMLWPNEKTLVLFVGVVTLFSFSVFFWRYSRNLALSFLIFICMGFWGMSFFILRQFVAMSILLFSYPFLEKRQFLPFALLVALAAQFHQSAWIFLFVYLLSYFKRDARYHVILLGFAAALFVLGPNIINLLRSIFRNGGIYTITGEVSGISYLILLTIVLIVSEIFATTLRERPYNHMLAFGAVIQILSLRLSVFVRIVYYFSLSLTLIIPNVCAEIEDKRLRLLAHITVVSLLLAFYFFISNCHFPEGFVWYLSIG